MSRVVGNLGRDPAMRYTPNGQAAAQRRCEVYRLSAEG